jgi:hypothetical protein
VINHANPLLPLFDLIVTKNLYLYLILADATTLELIGRWWTQFGEFGIASK